MKFLLMLFVAMLPALTSAKPVKSGPGLEEINDVIQLEGNSTSIKLFHTWHDAEAFHSGKLFLAVAVHDEGGPTTSLYDLELESVSQVHSARLWNGKVKTAFGEMILPVKIEMWVAVFPDQVPKNRTYSIVWSNGADVVDVVPAKP